MIEDKRLVFGYHLRILNVKGALAMASSTLRVLGCVVLALSASGFAVAQKQPKKTSSISGKVTLKGAGVPGMSVGAVTYGPGGGNRLQFVATTDAQGNYVISDLPAGMYELTPAAPQFVLTAASAPKRVIVEEGETLDDIDFTLVRGGVITGRVTNSDGQPLIEEPINVDRRDDYGQSGAVMSVTTFYIQTDDRGIYRVFGLAPGKYIVSTGTGQPGYAGRNGFKYKQTFHPAATDPAQATVVQVSEGGEATNVDIVVTARQVTYSASGRVINSETGKPLPNVRFSLTRLEENGSWGTSGPSANGLGEFKIDNLTPGKYTVSLERTMSGFFGDNSTSNLYADAVPFEISDHDVTDLIVKTTTGASVSGVVVFDGMDQKTARQKYGELLIMVAIPTNERFVKGRNGPPVRVAPDGSFSAGGLASGDAVFMVFAQMGAENGRNFEIARVERDGVAQQRSLEIKEREQVTGVRVVVTALTGIVQGIVKVENGQIDPARIFVSLSKAGDNRVASLPVDARGRFRVGGIAAGTYNITAYSYTDSATRASAKQQIVVNEDQVTEVSLTLDLTRSPLPQDRP